MPSAVISKVHCFCSFWHVQCRNLTGLFITLGSEIIYNKFNTMFFHYLEPCYVLAWDAHPKRVSWLGWPYVSCSWGSFLFTIHFVSVHLPSAAILPAVSSFFFEDQGMVTLNMIRVAWNLARYSRDSKTFSTKVPGSIKPSQGLVGLKPRPSCCEATALTVMGLSIQYFDHFLLTHSKL